jgi:hypothetical protein
MLPQARRDQLFVQDVGDDLVVYDQEGHLAHRLSRTAALVWRHCDGQHSVEDLAALLAKELNAPAAGELVWLGLTRLGEANLLQQPLVQPARVSRRQVLRKLGRVAAAAILVPTITSIIAPTPAMAQSEEFIIVTACQAFHASARMITGAAAPSRAEALRNAQNAAHNFCGGLCRNSGFACPATFFCVVTTERPPGGRNPVYAQNGGMWTCTVDIDGCNCQCR